MQSRLYLIFDAIIAVICLPFYAMVYLFSRPVIWLYRIPQVRVWHLRRKYQAGTEVSRFIAPDIRREVKIIDASNIETGVLTVRTRTWNVLYASRGMIDKPAFGPAREVNVEKLWKWSGSTSGGQLPHDVDGTSS